MPKKTLKTSCFTLDELAKREQHLEQILGSLKACRDAIGELGEDEIYVFASKSYERGIKQLDGFADELRAAMNALARGSKYTANTKKNEL